MILGEQIFQDETSRKRRRIRLDEAARRREKISKAERIAWRRHQDYSDNGNFESGNLGMANQKCDKIQAQGEEFGVEQRRFPDASYYAAFRPGCLSSLA